MQKLKEKWGIKKNYQILLIFAAFAVNGTLATRLANPVTHLVGVDRETTAAYIYWPVRILFIFPIYQITLVFVGAFFGQFAFFWKMQKKMLKRMGLGRLFEE